MIDAFKELLLRRIFTFLVPSSSLITGAGKVCFSSFLMILCDSYCSPLSTTFSLFVLQSTLLNLILGIIEPIKGSVSRNGRLRIGHFTQHSADKFDLQLSSVENMMQLFPGVGDQEMRSFVGRFQIQGTEALKPMFLLSGGQKSRVAFASLAYQKPHVIIMDEPTNHLDMESIDALVEAIKSFRGGLMVVSHDQYFITNTCSELWVVGDGKATRFRGDFDDYKAHTLERTRKRVEASVKRLGAINN